MLKTILTAACASALLAGGAAFAQSASSPQGSTVKDPARMEKPAWTNPSDATTQPYPSKSGAPSGFDEAEKKAMDPASGKRDRTMGSTDRGRSGASAGASSIAPQCASMAREEEVTRCLNRHMADLAARGESPTR